MGILANRGQHSSFSRKLNGDYEKLLLGTLERPSGQLRSKREKRPKIGFLIGKFDA